MGDGIQRVREVLMNHWDPIGIAGVLEASDEYDSIALRLYSFISTKLNVGELEEEILKIERNEMGLPGNQNRAFLVASILKGQA